MKNTYRDKCDKCGQFDYCKGHNGKVLCPKCIAEENDNGEK